MSAGIQSAAAEQLKVNRSAICKFVAKHPQLRILIEDITDEINDLAESGLIIALKAREPWAIKFWLAERGQARGFGMRKLAFRDEDGQLTQPAALIHDGRMTEDDWVAKYGPAPVTIDQPPPALNS